MDKININTPYSLFKKLEKDNLSFIYQGEFSDAITDKVLRLSENAVNNVKELSKLKKKISFLMAECFQNIIRHGDKPEIINRTNNKPGMFMARNIGNGYYIASANLVDNKKVESLRSKLRNVNSLNQEELKALHLELLSNNELSDKGGAGLGLVEMARKSGQSVDYDFEFVNYFLSLFFIQTKLKGTISPEETKEEVVSINDAKDLYNRMYLENILLVYKGDFSQESILPVLSMIENNLQQKSANYNIQKIVFYLSVELLQNISKHAMEKHGVRNGIFIIGEDFEHYIITTGNQIENEKVESLKTHLNNINNQDRNSLTEFYKKNLVEKGNGFKGGAGLGLIDAARYSNKLLFDIQPIDETTSFFSLSVVV